MPVLARRCGRSAMAVPVVCAVRGMDGCSCPREVHISSGLDVLFHALESWTAIPYTERTPRPSSLAEGPLGKDVRDCDHITHKDPVSRLE
jgi:hydroxyacid-oxoacid transhydrogenase